MSCCGEKRTRFRQSAGPPAAGERRSPIVAATPPAVPPAAGVRLRYRGGAATVRGPLTQRAYVFTPARPVQTVDPRDAPALLRTGLFRPAGAT
jgi:hypothetical protein